MTKVSGVVDYLLPNIMLSTFFFKGYVREKLTWSQNEAVCEMGAYLFFKYSLLRKSILITFTPGL